MAITKLSNLINPQVMGDMIEAKINASAKLIPYAKVDTSLQGTAGDTKTVPSWNYIGDAEDFDVETASNTDAEMSTSNLTASSTTFTIKCAGKSVAILQTAINSGLGDPVGQAESQLAKSIVGKVDNDLLAESITSANIYDGTTAKIGYTPIVEAIDVFDEEEVTEKVMFIAPSQVTDLRKDSNFIDKNKYGNDVMVSGEIGMVAGARIKPSKKVPLVKATLSTSSTDGATKITSSNIATYQGFVFDATNKKMVEIAANDYVMVESHPYFLNPVIKLEPANAETEFTEDELPALTIFLKKDTQVDHEWFPKKQRHDVTAAKYYGVALTNEAKVVVAKIKK